MSGTLAEKIQILKGLDEKEKSVLTFIMADKNVKVKDIASKMGFSEVYIRGFITSIYKKLEVPEGEEDKRGWIIRGYSEAYLKIDEVIPPPSEPKVEPTPQPKVEPKPPPLEPRINVVPGTPRTNRTAATCGVVAGIVVIAVIAIGVLILIIQGLNRPTNPTTSNNPSIPPSGRYDKFEDITLSRGVVLSGGGYGGGYCDTTEDHWSQSLAISNNSGYDYTLSIGEAKFSLVDNLGNSYQLFSAEIVGQPTGTKYQTLYSGHSATIMLCWLGRPTRVGIDYLDLTIMDIYGGPDIVIRNSSPRS
jgi:hypothetical protein